MKNINQLYDLTGKIAVVTGSGGLLGKYHCRALAEAGATVIATDLNEQSGKETAAKLGNNSAFFKADITQPDSVKALRKFILTEFKTIDILVNNAAINDKVEGKKDIVEESKFENFPLQLWQNSLNVNLTGSFLCSKYLGGEMAAKKSGSIINIASTYGIVAPDQSLYIDKKGARHFYKSPAYPVTKAALISFTRYLAAYWGEKGVRVNTLTPGGVENYQESFFIENYAKRTPLGRMAKPWDYKGALVFLASEASGYMTGANLVIDGGFTIW
ncbi:MAG: D-threitol dehydrogenase [Ignavibacteriales bacterium]